MGLRVLQASGQSATILPVVIRNLFRLLDFLPMGYFAGSTAIFFSRADKRFGDMVAGTIVVAEATAEQRKRRARIDKRIARLQAKGLLLPDLAGELGAAERALLDERDWQLLSGWAERLDPKPPVGAQGLEQRIWLHFTELGHSRAAYPTRGPIWPRSTSPFARIGSCRPVLLLLKEASARHQAVRALFALRACGRGRPGTAHRPAPSPDGRGSGVEAIKSNFST